MAQLIIDGKSYGPTPFCVQIRDLKTHEPLENIHIGDIGPKFGYNTMDNGFLLFNKVKVPHISMLARYTHVDPTTNKFGRRGSPSLVYGTLTWVRSTIVMQAGSVLARGVTIATRYCAVRRQFQDRDAPAGEAETPVLNYTMVQIRLLPLLAATFALHFTGKAMMDMYQENQKKIAQGNASNAPSKRGAGPEEVQSGSDMLADLHASSCALKSLSSSIACDGLEVCRRACGGHGYSSFSGIGPWYSDYLPTTTWEGDNYMLTQQVARYVSFIPFYKARVILIFFIDAQVRPLRPQQGEAHKRHHSDSLGVPLSSQHWLRLRHHWLRRGSRRCLRLARLFPCLRGQQAP